MYKLCLQIYTGGLLTILNLNFCWVLDSLNYVHKSMEQTDFFLCVIHWDSCPFLCTYSFALKIILYVAFSLEISPVVMSWQALWKKRATLTHLDIEMTLRDLFVCLFVYCAFLVPPIERSVKTRGIIKNYCSDYYSWKYTQTKCILRNLLTQTNDF